MAASAIPVSVIRKMSIAGSLLAFAGKCKPFIFAFAVQTLFFIILFLITNKW